MAHQKFDSYRSLLHFIYSANSTILIGNEFLGKDKFYLSKTELVGFNFNDRIDRYYQNLFENEREVCFEDQVTERLLDKGYIVSVLHDFDKTTVQLLSPKRKFQSVTLCHDRPEPNGVFIKTDFCSTTLDLIRSEVTLAALINMLSKNV